MGTAGTPTGARLPAPRAPELRCCAHRLGRHQRRALRARSHRLRTMGRDVARTGRADVPHTDLEARRDTNRTADGLVAIQGPASDPVLRSARRQVVPPDAAGY